MNYLDVTGVKRKNISQYNDYILNLFVVLESVQ